ncbi:hypothetical protein AHAS_Ahas18G0083200 [Arachis hypogaea]
MTEEKKAIVRDLGFGGLMHIPPLRVHHQMLRELANNFKLGENRLETGYGSFKITPRKIGHALGINATGNMFPQKVEYKKLSEDDKIIFRRFQGKTLKSLTDEMMDIGVENKGKKRAERPPKPWIANWSKEQLVERMNAETEEILNGLQKKKEDETYEISSEELDELLRGNVEKSAAEGENQADLRSTEGRYVSSETIPAVNLGSDDPSSQGRTEQSSVNQPSKSMLSPADSNMMVVREQTPSDALAIVPIQVFVPASQTTTVLELQETPETDFEPTPPLQIEGTIETTPEPPQQLQETTPTLPPAPSKIHPDAEDVAALMMMARTVSYVPKTDPVPSFSLGLTNSSQEGASTQETERAKSPETANLLEQLDDLVQKIASSAAKEKSKSPQIQRETGGESSGKFETPEGINQITDDMKEKCYIWGTRLKTYADGSTNEYDHMCTLIAQDNYILYRMHLASLQAESYIESEIISAMCHILNRKNDKRFQEQVYCLPPILAWPFRSTQMGNSYLRKPIKNSGWKTTRIFAPVCYSGHWWLWVIDTTKWRCRILDPLHKKAPSDERKQLNKFTGYVFSRLRAYAGGEPLQKDEKEKEIKASYVKISGQKSSYDCGIYVMKWLELIELENIKKGKYEWDNWKQEEADHYRVEYASRILFSEMNKERDQAIRESNAIRLSKPSSVLLSPFCQINSADIETA